MFITARVSCSPLVGGPLLRLIGSPFRLVTSVSTGAWSRS